MYFFEQFWLKSRTYQKASNPDLKFQVVGPNIAIASSRGICVILIFTVWT